MVLPYHVGPRFYQPPTPELETISVVRCVWATMMPIDRIAWDELEFFVIPCSVVFLIYCVIMVTQLRLRKLVEKELAEHANELKQFITVASHEVFPNNPSFEALLLTIL